MSELTELSEHLQHASLNGRFVDALEQSPLGNVRVKCHPLGFRVARLVSGNQTLRLHMWPAGAVSAQPGFEVHDHAFNFRAHVLLGQLEQELYDAFVAPDGANAAYEVSYTADGSHLKKRPGRIRLKTRSRVHIGPLQSYELTSDTPHRVRTDGRVCATLVLTKFGKDDVTTFGPFDGPQILAFPRKITGRCAWEEYFDLTKSEV